MGDNFMEKKDMFGLHLILVLLLIFISLKLTGITAWSWLWVISPLWVSSLIGLILVSIEVYS